MIIDSWLDGDKDVHRKQHHTAKRVFDRLRAEHGPIGATISDRVDQNFACIVIHDKSDDGFSTGWDGTQAQGDFIAETALVRRGL